MSTKSTFQSMLNPQPTTQRVKGLRGMNFHGLSFKPFSPRAKPDQSLNVWGKMLKGSK